MAIKRILFEKILDNHLLISSDYIKMIVRLVTIIGVGFFSVICVFKQQKYRIFLNTKRLSAEISFS